MLMPDFSLAMDFMSLVVGIGIAFEGESIFEPLAPLPTAVKPLPAFTAVLVAFTTGMVFLAMVAIALPPVLRTVNSPFTG